MKKRFIGCKTPCKRPALGISGIAFRSSFIQRTIASQCKCDRVIFLTRLDLGRNISATDCGIIEFPGSLHKEISFCLRIVGIFCTVSKKDDSGGQNNEDEIKGLHKT